MGADKDILVVDAVTGELYEKRPRKTKRTEPFYMTNQRDSVELARMKLTGMEHRILRYLEGIMDYDNVASVAQAFLAKELETTEATISASVKGLEKAGLIRKTEVCGRKVFIVSKSVSTRGKVKQGESK